MLGNLYPSFILIDIIVNNIQTVMFQKYSLVSFILASVCDLPAEYREDSLYWDVLVILQPFLNHHVVL